MQRVHQLHGHVVDVVDELRRDALRVGPLSPRVDNDDPRPGGRRLRRVLAERLGEPGCTELHDDVGQRRLRPHDGVGRRDGALYAAARQRIAEHGPPETLREVEHVPGVGFAERRPAGDDDAAPLERRARPGAAASEGAHRCP